MINAVISEIRIEADDIVSLELQSADGSALPAFSAGAHIDVHLPNSLIRQYSLWNDPADSHRYCIGVLRDPQSRGGSVAVHNLQVGQRVEISAPRNLFPLEERAKRSILFAGGIGITPIMAMAQRLHRLGADFELHYCSRSVDRAAFVGLLQESEFAHRVKFYYDSGEEAAKLDIATVLRHPDHETHLYVCGPGGYMAFILDSAREAGWNEANLHREYFSAPTFAAANVDGESFELVIQSSGKTLLVGPEQTALEVLEAAGITIPVSCEQGICGTCVTRVIDGIPDHRDLFMTDAEHDKNDQFTPCCSRSRSPRLVLDL